MTSWHLAKRYTAVECVADRYGRPCKTSLLHLSGRVRFAKADLEVGVRNLLDREYPELRAGGFVAPGQPRSLFANLRYVF